MNCVCKPPVCTEQKNIFTTLTKEKSILTKSENTPENFSPDCSGNPFLKKKIEAKSGKQLQKTINDKCMNKNL
ncbi:hypothetical protein ACM39_03470 [Chryseobacterium sp. FH2]|nr:hypothetical protein ACM39_03470 [Chryseobacterium sp. FH2]